MAKSPAADKSPESWIQDAACSIRGAKDAAKDKDYILPLISDVCPFQSRGTPSKQNPKIWREAIPSGSPEDLKRPRLDDVQYLISQKALESGRKLAPVALAEVPMAINQGIRAIIPNSKLRSDFLLYALATLRENLFKKVGRPPHGTYTVIGRKVTAFGIPLPDVKSQEEIASANQNLERKKELHERKRSQLQNLFRTLLHKLMTAKTRVRNIELSERGLPEIAKQA